MRRIEELTEPPEVGLYYLVPTVRAEMFGKTKPWPCIGPKHNDKEFLAFDHQHYHMDGRFISPHLESWFVSQIGMRIPRVVASFPLMVNMGEFEYRQLRCYRTEASYDYPGPTFAPGKAGAGFYDLWQSFAGKTCDRDERSGIICPHRRAPLGSLVAHDGMIRCPLHGLLIHAATGIVQAPA